MSSTVIDHDQASRPDPAGDPAAPHLGWAVAGMSAGAGVIHMAMVPIHGGNGLLDPLGFAAFGWFQLIIAGLILGGRDGRRTYQAAVVGNVAAIALWVWSRTLGLPFGSHADIVEDVGVVDGVCVALQVGVVLLSARLLLSGERRSVGRLAPALLAVAALGLTTAVITSDDASTHSHTGAATAPALTGQAAVNAKIDATRCDEDVNVPAYWREAKYLDIDTRQGGQAAAATTAAAAPAASSDGHDHSHAAAAVDPSATTTTTEPDPNGGRGSAELDGLVSATSSAGSGVGAAAQLVIRLGEASDATYDAWLWWLRSTGALTHSHDAAASGDSGGHGGHVGPQPWVALTDKGECEQLDEELAQSQKVALAYPTAQDAMDAGWVRVTSYVPGIAAHYMNFDYVDGEFEIDEPEMILYDGDDPDAHVVGLSYYIILGGSAEPTQGFTGANDHGHRHVGLCTGPGGVIGDSTLTEEECAARGGRKANGSKAWMIHAWVVPGCESPWGVFSAASPLLDKALGDASGDNDGHCSASAVRGRYGMDQKATSKSTGS